MFSINFLGAAGTVTGSKYFIHNEKEGLLIDCGLYQGLKELRLRNWEPLPINPKKIKTIVITHAHIDHTGYLPLLVKQGFSGEVLMTSATMDLCKILLPDSAHLQEEEANYANKKGYSKHKPALPLYNSSDAYDALQHLKAVEYGKIVQVSDNISFRLQDAGHILGSSMAEIWLKDGEKTTKVVFSGDLGRYNVPIMRDPSIIEDADYLVSESTYGDRLHSATPVDESLAGVINESIKMGGIILVPAFAVERTQEILYIMEELLKSGKIPDIPLYIDSPMAISVNQVFTNHREDFDEETLKRKKEGRDFLEYPNLHIASTIDQSKSINSIASRAFIMSASGMATGGRVLHHLVNRLPSPKNIILLVGYQAAGTRGRDLQDGAESLKIYGEKIPVKAKIITIDGFSSHADYNEILKWYGGFKKAPKKLFLTHGEPKASQSMAEKAKEKLGWETYIPKYLDDITLE
ncbi:MAG: MBL fold metallo-hydrolase [Firmicutes bacterium]|nr:MBL fold metallo-hydrolase [Bacillota bacterium]